MSGWVDGSWQKLHNWASRQAVSIGGEARLLTARADCLRTAIERSEAIAAGQIVRDFRELHLAEVVDDILGVLRQCLIVMITSTGGGALIGGIAGGIGGVGIGAIPGAAVGAAAGAQVGEWILVVMGLKVLAEYIVQDMPKIARSYRDGLRQAWLAASPPALPQQQVQVNAFALQSAAATLARGHVEMFVLLLMGIVAYLARGRGNIGELADNMRNSKLGARFATWMTKNESRIESDARFQPKQAPAQKPSAADEPRIAPTKRPRPSLANKTAPKLDEKPPFRGTIKYRSAEDANTELFDRGIADPAHPPFKAGTQVADRTMMPGEKVNMLIDDGQLKLLQDPNKVYGLGGWGSPENFSSQSQGLAKMGITSGPGGFKPNGVKYQIQLEALKPVRILEGTAGPQGALAGGGQQTYLDVPAAIRRSTFKMVGVTLLPKP